MAISYRYILSSDFGGNINSYQFVEEIKHNISITPVCTHINTDRNNVDIWFDTSLSVSEKNLLDTLVSAHVPSIDVGSGLYAESSDNISTNNTSYQQKLKLSTGLISSGNYILHWYAEVATDSTRHAIIFRIQQDDTIDITESGKLVKTTTYDYESISGFKKLELSAKSYDFDVDFRARSNSGSVHIKNVRLWLEKCL